MSLVMDESAPFVSPLLDQSDDFSTGYLEDALVEFSECFKRRRLLLLNDDIDDNQTNQISSMDFAMSYMNNNHNSNCNGQDLSGNFSCMNQTPSFNGVSEFVPEDITPGIEAIDSSSSSSVNHKTKSIFNQDTKRSSAGNSKKMVAVKRVMYPFTVVKPGGKEGDVTLNDINERILMTPTRPVRHPVGDFAYRPCVSGDGPGLSGKAVVALTRIHTQGSGTITIIRTKG